MVQHLSSMINAESLSFITLLNYYLFSMSGVSLPFSETFLEKQIP